MKFGSTGNEQQAQKSGYQYIYIYIYIYLVFCGNEDCCSTLCELHFLATLSRMLLHPIFLQVATSKVLLH